MAGATDWTERDVPHQAGRVALVTGANSGIGFETARALAQHGALVLLGCRNPDRAALAQGRIQALRPSGAVEVLDLDLADLDKVAAAAAELRRRHDRLDLLVNNAGVMGVAEGTTAQGFETQLGINHFGHFALTGALLPALLATPGSRVVTVSSQGHRLGRIDLADPQHVRRYGPWRAYFRSKLANLLFTAELQRRLAAAHASTIAVAAHPGGSDTNIATEVEATDTGIVTRLMKLTRPLGERFAQSAAQGALPILRAATDPAVRGGDYYGPDGFLEQRGKPVPVRSARRARDANLAARLWRASVEATGADFSALDAARS
ncbi:MAG: oxidoreductase [Acidimicrobiia bacterium]